MILRRRCGEILHCLHSTDVKEGCGRAPYCRQCVVRNAVNEAFSGQTVVRHRTKMQLVSDSGVTDLYVLVTASKFVHVDTEMVLLVIEDISEIAELQRLVPICAKCKKIRDDDQYWTNLEAFFKRHWDLDFTHGYCPACAEEERRGIDEAHANQTPPPGGSS